MYKDHLGNPFKDLVSLCRYWGIDYEVVKDRIDKGWAVTTAIRDLVDPYAQVMDHLGNTYDTIREMCSKWGISIDVYNKRMYTKAWELEKTLTTPAMERNVLTVDHLGNEFKSPTEMCKHYGVSYRTYKRKLEKGVALEGILVK